MFLFLLAGRKSPGMTISLNRGFVVWAQTGGDDVEF